MGQQNNTLSPTIQMLTEQEVTDERVGRKDQSNKGWLYAMAVTHAQA